MQDIYVKVQGDIQNCTRLRCNIQKLGYVT